MKVEADELRTSMVTHPPGAAERFALVMVHDETESRMHFFITREEAHYLAQSIIEMVGYDS